MILQVKKEAKGVDAFTTSSEITILTASATLQGREVRQAMDKSFADLYHDLDGGFTPLVSLPLYKYFHNSIFEKKANLIRSFL